MLRVCLLATGYKLCFEEDLGVSVQVSEGEQEEERLTLLLATFDDKCGGWQQPTSFFENASERRLEMFVDQAVAGQLLLWPQADVLWTPHAGTHPSQIHVYDLHLTFIAPNHSTLTQAIVVHCPHISARPISFTPCSNSRIRQMLLETKDETSERSLLVDPNPTLASSKSRYCLRTSTLLF